MVARGARQALPADRRRGQLPQRGADAPVRRRPRGARRGPGRDDPVGGLERRPQGRRRLHRPLAARQRGLGQRPELGQPSLDVRRRRPHGAQLPVLRRRHRRRWRSTRCCAALRAPAGEERRAAARLLPQPDRRRPDARAVGRAGADAAPSASCCRTSTSPTRASATASSKTPMRCARSPRARPDGRPLAFFVANSFSKSMSLYGERCGALSVVCADAGEAEQRPRPAQVHGAAQLLEPADPRRPDRRRGADRARRCAAPGRPSSAAMRERIQAMRKALHGVLAAKVPGRDFGYFLTPARHVQLHRPDAARRSTGCARSSRSTWCARAGCASPA